MVPHLFRIFDVLPGHRHPIRKRTHELLGQVHVSRKNDANARRTRGLKRPSHSLDDQVAIFDLVRDARLHVVDQQGKASWLADVLKCAGNINAEDLFHDYGRQSDPDASIRNGAIITPASKYSPLHLLLLESAKFCVVGNLLLTRVPSGTASTTLLLPLCVDFLADSPNLGIVENSR